LQFSNGVRWKKIFLPKVSYQRSITSTTDRRIGIMLMEAD
jgi:hypothetical protein